MRRPLCALVLPAVIALAACSEHSTPAAPAAPATEIAAGQTCQFGLIPDFARLYFNLADFTTSQQIARAMAALYHSGDLTGATDKGFDLLALIAAARDGGRVRGTAQNGSDLGNAVLACMSVGQVSLPVDFTGALTGGGFEVRGGANDPGGPVLSQDQFSGVGLRDHTWGSILGGRTLFFGLPDPNTAYAELLVGQPFTWSTIPARPSIPPGLVVGFCVLNPGRFRVATAHPQAPQMLLNLYDASFFLSNCGTPLSVNAASPSAAGSTAGGPVGGSATGFSGFAPVDPVAINLTFVQQPSTVQVGRSITPPVRVLAAGNGGTPLPQVTIQIGALDAQGNLIPLKRPTTTGTDGLATFGDLYLQQPGTYTLVVRATAVGYTAVRATSVPFTVTP